MLTGNGAQVERVTVCRTPAEGPEANRARRLRRPAWIPSSPGRVHPRSPKRAAIEANWVSRAARDGGMNRKRVVIAGLGDVGVLTAIRLARRTDVVGISVKPALVSGQELGIRLARPEDWARDYWIPFDRFRRLDGVRTVQATLIFGV